MSNLSAFLAQNVIEEPNIKYVASKRFIDKETGEPELWEITRIDAQENEELRKSCTKMVQLPGKRGQFVPETDHNLYMGKLAARCTVYPDLNSKELQDSYGVMGADKVLKKMLKAGEYDDYTLKVLEVCGFENDFESKVETVKNE